MASVGLVLFPILVAISTTYVACAPIRQENIVPIEVDVYYESLCPDSRRFFLKQLWPVYKKIENGIKLSLIPYGNAQVRGSPNKWTFACQHGQEECLGNIIQTCAIEVMNNTMENMKFVVCAFNSPSQEIIIKQCIRDKDLQTKISECANGPMGKNLEHQMAVLTDALNPPQNFIPWITINKKGSNEINDRANTDLFDLLCDTYEGEKPSACPESPKRKKSINYYDRGVYL